MKVSAGARCRNHNPSRIQTLLKALLGAGFSVQLVHVPAETDWSDQDVHGFVALKSDKGAELFRKGGFQHNMNLRVT